MASTASGACAHASRRPALAAGYAEDEVDVSALLSGRKITSRSRRFRGGKVAAMFGGVQLDLVDAALAPDARLDVTVAFGWRSWCRPAGGCA